MTYATPKIGAKVVTTDDPKLCRWMWHKLGTVVEHRDADSVWMRFDPPLERPALPPMEMALLKLQYLMGYEDHVSESVCS